MKNIAVKLGFYFDGSPTAAAAAEDVSSEEALWSVGQAPPRLPPSTPLSSGIELLLLLLLLLQ